MNRQPAAGSSLLTTADSPQGIALLVCGSGIVLGHEESVVFEAPTICAACDGQGQAKSTVASASEEEDSSVTSGDADMTTDRAG